MVTKNILASSSSFFRLLTNSTEGSGKFCNLLTNHSVICTEASGKFFNIPWVPDFVGHYVTVPSRKFFSI